MFGELEAARNHLADRADCTGRVGVLGFLHGGSFVLAPGPGLMSRWAGSGRWALSSRRVHRQADGEGGAPRMAGDSSDVVKATFRALAPDRREGCDAMEQTTEPDGVTTGLERARAPKRIKIKRDFGWHLASPRHARDPQRVPDLHLVAGRRPVWVIVP